VECLKAILYKGGFKMQLGLELGEHVETIDKALTGTIFRLAIELIFGLLAGLFASSRKVRSHSYRFSFCSFISSSFAALKRRLVSFLEGWISARSHRYVASF
jgi:hypothetical protein